MVIKMGIFSGYLCLFCFCFLSLKAVTKRLHWKKADRAFMKAHKFVSAALLVLCFLHIILIIPVLKGRNFFVILSGSITVVVMLFLIALCHMIKDGKKKMWWHRAFTIWMAVCITGHIAVYITDFNTYQRNMEKAAQVLESFEEIDWGKMADGIYEGEYDAVSGATNSSNVIRMAVGNALPNSN